MKRVLFDEDVTRQMRQALSGVEVRTVPEAGWSGLKNGELLRRAENLFDVFVTADRKLPFQQNLSMFAIGVVVSVAGSTKLEDLRPLAAELMRAIENVQPRELILVPHS